MKFEKLDLVSRCLRTYRAAVPFVFILLVSFSTTLRGDASYDRRIEVTGGAVLKEMTVGGAKKEERSSKVETCLIKGNRIAFETREYRTIVNLENETIYTLDLKKKTYSTTTFSQLKDKVGEVKKTAAEKSGAGDDLFDVSTNSGRTKKIGMSDAREQRIEMTRDGVKGNDVAHIFVDFWTLSVPRFPEIAEFREKLAAKLGYAYALGLEEIASVKPELLPGFERAAKAIIQSSEVPVQTTIRMGDADSGDLAPANDTAPEKDGLVAGTLNRIESLAHKKSRRDEASDATYPGLLAEVTIELGNFGSGTIEEAKFNVPAGFKELKASTSRSQ